MQDTLPQSPPYTLEALRTDLDELVSQGLVRRLPGGRYTLTPKGEQALKAARDGQ